MSGPFPATAPNRHPDSDRSWEDRQRFLDEFDMELKRLVSSAAYINAPAFQGRDPTDTERQAHTYLGDYARKPRIIEQYWKASPGSEVLNIKTGELTTVPTPVSYRGGDLTLAQLAEQLQLGPRHTRAALADLGMLHEELEAKMVEMYSDKTQLKPEYSARQRLSEWAVKMGYGRRVKGGTGHGLDWITPSGLNYIERILALPAAVSDPRASMEQKWRPKAIDVIRQLLHDTPDIRQAEIVRRTGFSKMTVHRNRMLLGEKVTLPSPSVI